MTTGRINQVAADVTSLKMKLVRVRVSGETRLRWFQVGRASLFGSLLPILLWSRMRPRMGFALVCTTQHAGVRAQANCSLCVGPAESCALLHQHPHLVLLDQLK